jgi:hypothetical protein
MGLDLSGLGALTSNLGALVPAPAAIIENVVTAAAGSVVLKGLQAGGAASLDPLGLFPHPANNPNAVNGPTITASAFASMPPQAQGAFLAAQGHIVADHQ